MKSYFWYPVWNKARPDEGLEHLMLDDHSASGQISAFDSAGRPFRCVYNLRWDGDGATREVQVKVRTEEFTRHLFLNAEKVGQWRNAQGTRLEEYDGCLDVDIWPTPFTNSLAMWRLKLTTGTRENLRALHISAPEMIVKVQRQAYTKLQENLYRYEGLDSNYVTELPIDEQGIVLDYPGVFRRYGWKDN